MNNHQALLGRLQKRKINVKSRKRGNQKGSRRSNKFGSSLEFSDFRAYQPDDDVRQIDWNVYGRTGKHYIKRFLDEQELSIGIYLDATSSMRENAGKWQFSKQLAAALAYMVLAGEDRLLFSAVSSVSMHPVKRKGAVYSRRTFTEILNFEEKGKSENFIENLKESLTKKQQLSIVITDGMEPLENIEALTKKMKALKQEIWFFQVLSEEEMFPHFSGDMKLIDSETEKSVNVSINASIIADYENRLREHNKQLELLCRRFGGHYFLVSANGDLQSILFRELSGKGLIS